MISIEKFFHRKFISYTDELSRQRQYTYRQVFSNRKKEHLMLQSIKKNICCGKNDKPTLLDHQEHDQINVAKNTNHCYLYG